MPATYPTPTYGLPGVGSFTVSTSGRILASPDTCMQVLLDAARYPEWNRFCPVLDIDEQPPNTSGPGTLKLGTKATLQAHVKAAADDKLDVTEEEKVARALRPTPMVVTVLGTVDETSEKDREVNAVATQLLTQPAGPRAEGDGQTTKTRLRVTWRTRDSWTMPGWALRAERTQEFHLVDSGPGSAAATDYVCWETFYGVLAPVVKLLVGVKLAVWFEMWRDDLKLRAETTERDVHAAS